MWELKLADILREVLTAGAARDWDRMIELSLDLEELARSQRAILDPGADEFPGDGHPDANPG
ncbi:unnamed protein product [marine sediment metagenome]|uniref:Uncharacterized protein n=1 Tax=marine sediment metagenome TaxID=412755 RepID=X1RXF9_9ZZZZ